MSGHSSPTSEHGKGRHAEYFLETFPTATSFMMNPKEFVERLTRIRDNKRNVLEAMGKLKSKFEGDIDKIKLQRLVSLYDDLKKQEDEYLCIFRSVFPGKHGSTDSLPGATAAGSGATSSPTGSTGSRKATASDPVEQQGSKRSNWCPNVAMSSSGDSAFFELQEAQDALVKMLEHHKTMQGLDVSRTVERVKQRQPPEFNKADLSKQRERLMAKQVELEQLKAKLETFKRLCSQPANAATDQSNGNGPADVDDDEFVQERLSALRDRKEHMEGLLRDLHNFEEDIGQAISPQARLPTESAECVNSLLDGELRIIDEATGGGKSSQNGGGSDNGNEAKRHLESKIQSHIETIQKLKEEQGRLMAMKNKLLMLNSAAEQQQAGLVAPNARSLKQMSAFQAGNLGAIQESLAKRRPLFGSSTNSSAGMSDDDDDDDSFEHVGDLQDSDQRAAVLRSAGQKIMNPFPSSVYRRCNVTGEIGDLVGAHRTKKQKESGAADPCGFKNAANGVGRKGSLTNFGTSSLEQQYQQLQQHIDSIRAIFKEVALTGAVVDEGTSANKRQPCDDSVCSNHRNSVCYFNAQQQQQQAVMLAVLTCQQQIQMQQMELASLRNWCHSTLGEAGRPPRPEREQVKDVFAARYRQPLWSNGHHKSPECRPPTDQEAYYGDAAFEGPCTSFEEPASCHMRGGTEERELQARRGRNGSKEPTADDEPSRLQSGTAASDADNVGQLPSADDEVRQEMATLMELNKQRPEYLLQLLRQLRSLSLEQLDTAGTGRDEAKTEMCPAENDRCCNVAEKSVHFHRSPTASGAEEFNVAAPPEKLRNVSFHSVCLSVRSEPSAEPVPLELIEVKKNVLEKTKLVMEEADRIMRAEFGNWEDGFLDENALLVLRFALLVKLKECLFNGDDSSLFLVKVSDELHPVLYAFVDRSFNECWPELRSNLEGLVIRQLETALQMAPDSGGERNRCAEPLSKSDQEETTGEVVEHCAQLTSVSESLACREELCLQADSAKTSRNFESMKIAFIDDLPSDESAIQCEEGQSTRDGSSDGSNSLNSMEIVNAESCSDSVRFIENDKQEYSSVTVDYKAVHPNRVKCTNTVTVHVPNDRERANRVVRVQRAPLPS
uniref:Pericentriolar material 1 protein C-terminal domain-containing protein n=1 Tax=Trichuris muris TaxID=70415 RepID=A0A5S6PYK2_TRIMR